VRGGAAVAFLLIAAAACAPGANEGAERAAHAAVAAELGDVAIALGSARDSTSTQLEALSLVLTWMEGTSDASSSGLIDILTRLRERARAPGSLETVADLVATCSLQRISSPELRRRFLALNRALAELAQIGEPAFERYRLRLEESLSPGMWRLVFLSQSGTHPVDYRTALSELSGAGFDRTLRTLRRGAQSYADALGALATEAAALRDELRSNGRPVDEP
jgi:hypothetical protein